MTIAQRLVILLAVPLIAMFGIGIYGVVSLHQIEERTRMAAVLQAESLAALGNISRSQAEMRVNVRSCVLAPTEVARAEAQRLFNDDMNEVERLLAVYLDELITSDRDRELCIEYRDMLRRWEEQAAEVCALANAGKTNEAVAALDQSAPLGLRMSKVSREWIELNENIARAAGADVMRSIATAKRIAMFAGLGVLLLSSIIGALLVRSIVRPITRLRDSVEAIAKGDYSRTVPFTSAHDEAGALARSIDVLKTGAAATERQRWVKTHASRIINELQDAPSVGEFGKRLLTTLVPLLGGGVGAVYVLDQDSTTLRHGASYGRSDDGAARTIGIGQGLVGQCAADKRAITLTDLPADYPRIASALGEARPTRATCRPMIAGDTLVAVFEHGAFHAAAPEHEALLDEVLPAAAMTLEVLERNLRTQELLQITTRQAEEMRAQQEALAAREEQFRTLLESTPDALIISNEEGDIVLVNAQAERLLGYLRTEMIGQKIEMLVPERIRARHPQMRRKFHEDSNVRPMGAGMELSAVRKDGSEFPVEISLSPLKAPDGTALVVSSMRDITERKRAEIEIRAAKEKAEEATKAKSSFLANMSHEIRTPMNGVIGMTELALDTNLTAEQRDYLNTVKSSADALLSIINDILDFSKIEAGRIELDPVEFLLRDAISDTLNPLSLRASSKNVELAYEVASDVPDAIVGDIHRLRQVLVNLVGNAIKFTAKGEVVVSISMAKRTGDDISLHFAVRDTGIGISREAAARLFKPFEQAEASTTRKFGGTGLGLAISLQLVELMGGHIKLDSEPGVGSTFSFSVNMKVGTHRAPVDAQDAARLFEGKVALVVDDNQTNRRILETMLGNWGLRTISAEGGSDALAALDRTDSAGAPVAMLITDLHMPEMDGFQLVRAVRGRAASVALPVIMLTSSASPGDQAQSVELNVAARLIKPVKQSLLLDNIVRILAGPQQRESPGAAKAAQAATPSDGRSLRILLAEDNAVNQKFAVRLLTGAGHTVDVADNGRIAVEKSAANPFDIILMDVQMPELDGLDATREIRSREGGAGKRTPIIALTANAMTGDREMCLNAGMDGYVAKPIKKDLLFSEIDRILNGSPS